MPLKTLTNTKLEILGANQNQISMLSHLFNELLAGTYRESTWMLDILIRGDEWQTLLRGTNLTMNLF